MTPAPPDVVGARGPRVRRAPAAAAEQGAGCAGGERLAPEGRSDRSRSDHRRAAEGGESHRARRRAGGADRRRRHADAGAHRVHDPRLPRYRHELFLAAAAGGVWLAWTILAGDVRRAQTKYRPVRWDGRRPTVRLPRWTVSKLFSTPPRVSKLEIIASLARLLLKGDRAPATCKTTAAPWRFVSGEVSVRSSMVTASILACISCRARAPPANAQSLASRLSQLITERTGPPGTPSEPSVVCDQRRDYKIGQSRAQQSSGANVVRGSRLPARSIAWHRGPRERRAGAPCCGAALRSTAGRLSGGVAFQVTRFSSLNGEDLTTEHFPSAHTRPRESILRSRWTD